jgi:hypothetical protein
LHTALPFGRWIVATAFAALLAGCSTAVLDFDTTGSISKQQTQAAVTPAPTPVSVPAPVATQNRVFVLRGMMGAMFSTGMDDLAGELNARGMRASVHEREWEPVADLAIAEYKAAQGKMKIMLAGHSDGADGILAMSYRLQQLGIPVALAVTFDPTRMLSKPVPANVERYINLYQSSNLLGGGSARRVADFHGHFANVNLRERYDIGHVTIDKARVLHEAIIPKFVQVATFGSAPSDDAVPIDYVVPKDAGIEIWDSGIAINVGNGDTVETLATRYGVSAWGIRRVNTLADDARLTTGQRLIVPRKIVLPAPAPQIGGPLPEALALTQPQTPRP